MSIEANKRAQQLRETLIQEISGDNKKSATELSELALQGLANYGNALHPRSGEEFKQALIAFSTELQGLRPSLAALSHSLECWRQEFENAKHNSVLAMAANAQHISELLQKKNQQAVARIAQYAASLVKKGSTVFTHSHCPSVRYGLMSLKGINFEVITTESRPGMEGLSLAKQLGKKGIHTHYITDAQIGLFAPKADIILVGADTILNDGSAINKSGTYLVALAAAQARVPFYVCCESYKFSDLSPQSAILEKRNTAELGAPDSPMLQAHNIYFDITPRNLITAYITEEGIINPLQRFQA